MVFLDDLKEMTLYKKPFILPIDEENIRKGSAIFLVSPNAETSKEMMNYPYMINKMNTFNSYYLEKNANYYINQEGNLIPIDRDDEYLHEVSEDELEEAVTGKTNEIPIRTNKGILAINTHFANKINIPVLAVYTAAAMASPYLPLGLLVTDTLNQIFAIDFCGVSKKESFIDDSLFGESVVSINDGVVANIVNGIKDTTDPDMRNLFGNFIVIKHSSGYYSLYAHLKNNSITVNKGDRVKKGQVIAKIGTSGNSNIPHLHFQICYNDPSFATHTSGIGLTSRTDKFGGFYCQKLDGFIKGSAILKSDALIKNTISNLDDSKLEYVDAGFIPTISYIKVAKPVTESKDNSKYDSSFKKKTGKNFKYIQFPGAEAEKYLSNDIHWNKESIDDFKKRKVGEVAIDTEADAVAGWIFVNKSGTVGPLRVYDEYKGYGISNILVADAVNKYKGKELGVYSDNEIALKVYEKNGFRTYRTKTYKDGDKVYIMRLDENALNEEYTYYNDKKYKKVPKSAKLYHGSRTQNLKELTPKNDSVSRIGNATAVYASKDKRFAACYGTAWRDDIAKQGTWDKWNTVVMGLSDKVVTDQPCSLYELENDGSFIEISDKEVISLNTIKVKKEHKYLSYMEMLKQNGVKVISYDEYISNVKSSNPEFHYLNECRETTSITEAHDFEKYNPNFKKKTGGNFEFIDIHDAKAQEYLASDKYYNKQIKKYISIINGEIVVDKDTGKVAGAIYVGGGNKKSNRNYGFIQTLEVYKPYRGYGLSNKLIDDAIKKYNAVDLTVYRDNDVASELYKKHGFVIIGAGNTKNSDYWMKLKSKLTEEDKKRMEVFNEAALSSKERNELSDSDFGIPSLRKYPLTDAQHVKSAIRFFNYVDKEHEAELAKNIKRKAIEFKVPIRCGEGNRLSKYITEEYVQEFMSVASIGNDMTAVCNGTIRQHMSQGDMVYSFDHQKPYTKKTKAKKEEKPVEESKDIFTSGDSDEYKQYCKDDENEEPEDVFFDDMIKDIEKFCNEEPEPFPTDILNEKKGSH